MKYGGWDSALSPRIDRKGVIGEIRVQKRLFLFISPLPMNSHACSPSTCLIESPRLRLAGRPLTSWRHGRPVSSACIGFLGVQVPDAYRHGRKAGRKARLIENRATN